MVVFNHDLPSCDGEFGFCGARLFTGGGGGGVFKCAFFLRSVLLEWVSLSDRFCFPNVGG